MSSSGGVAVTGEASGRAEAKGLVKAPWSKPVTKASLRVTWITCGWFGREVGRETTTGGRHLGRVKAFLFAKGAGGLPWVDGKEGNVALDVSNRPAMTRGAGREPMRG